VCGVDNTEVQNQVTRGGWVAGNYMWLESIWPSLAIRGDTQKSCVDRRIPVAGSSLQSIGSNAI
jgi:hypothetical protein